jgi:excisionase family DNA binding protein
MAPMKRPAKPQPELDGTISITEAARCLHMTHKQVRDLLGTGKLNFVQIRRKFRIPKREVSALVRKITCGA